MTPRIHKVSKLAKAQGCLMRPGNYGAFSVTLPVERGIGSHWRIVLREPEKCTFDVFIEPSTSPFTRAALGKLHSLVLQLEKDGWKATTP